MLLVFGLLPGAGEALESLAGIEHGPSSDGTSERDEHGCTALLHVCGCHHAASCATTAARTDALPPSSIAVAMLEVDDDLGRPAATPILRPPIA